MKDRILYVWFQLALGVCNRLAGEICSEFDSIADVYNCTDFSFLGESKEKYIKRLESKDTSEAFEVLKKCESMGVGLVGYYDQHYPDSLRKIKIPPAVLYYVGELRDLGSIPCVAIVGSRKMTDYGKAVTENFAYTLSQSGVCVVSGLAKGIDTAAHRGAIKAGGYTVAVLGNPIGDVYPKENLKAFETLYKRGLVVSELYPGCPRTKADFPNRNRIISALSDAVLVAEAGENSGALITARHATEQGKPLYAIPGSIGSENAGTNQLIKKGAAIATDPQDILAPLLTRYPEVSRVYVPATTEKLRSYGNARSKTEDEIIPKVRVCPLPSDKAEENSPFADLPVDSHEEARLTGDTAAMILSVLDKNKPITADEIAAKTGLPVSDVMTELTFMEIEGSVAVSVGGRYTARKF